MRETWEKKVMKFEREIPIGLDARRKKPQGGAESAPPPMGLGLRNIFDSEVWTGGGGWEEQRNRAKI